MADFVQSSFEQECGSGTRGPDCKQKRNADMNAPAKAFFELTPPLCLLISFPQSLTAWLRAGEG